MFLRKLNKERDTLVMTTHSPFVLYALNNLLVGYMAHEQAPEIMAEITEIPAEACINPAEINVWELRNGHIENFDGMRDVTIQDEHGLIRDNYFDRVMGNVMTDFRNLMTLV